MTSIKILAAGILLLVLAGCMNPPIEGRAERYSSAQVNFVDSDLSDSTAIGKIKWWRDESQLLHVDVPIRNTRDNPIYVDYRITFLDANGIALGQPTGWTAVNLAPNVFQDIQANSTTPRAYDFRMDLRDAR